MRKSRVVEVVEMGERVGGLRIWMRKGDCRFCVYELLLTLDVLRAVVGQ